MKMTRIKPTSALTIGVTPAPATVNRTLTWETNPRLIGLGISLTNPGQPAVSIARRKATKLKIVPNQRKKGDHLGRIETITGTEVILKGKTGSQRRIRGAIIIQVAIHGAIET